MFDNYDFGKNTQIAKHAWRGGMHPRRNSPVTIAIQFIGEHGNTAAASLENTDFTNLATRLDILT